MFWIIDDLLLLSGPLRFSQRDEDLLSEINRGKTEKETDYFKDVWNHVYYHNHLLPNLLKKNHSKPYFADGQALRKGNVEEAVLDQWVAVMQIIGHILEDGRTDKRTDIN